MIRTSTLLSMIALAACAPEPRPVEPPAPPAAPAAVGVGVAVTVGPQQPVSAAATQKAPSAESAVYTRVKVVFTNPSKRPCAFTSYTLRWGTASKTFDLQTFTVPPGETRDRWSRVSPNDPGYEALAKGDVAEVAVEVKSDCPTR